MIILIAGKMISTKIAKIRMAAGKATQGEWSSTKGCIIKDGVIRVFVNDQNLIPILYIDHYRPNPDISNEQYIAIANPSTMLQLLDYISDLEKCVGVQGEALDSISTCSSFLYANGEAKRSITTVTTILEKYKDE
jgi:hypothetical protein